MAIFQPVDMMGPAHRGAQIQQLAQNAAQNVMRRQRMKSLIQSSASAAGQAAQTGTGAMGGFGGGGGNPFQGSMRGRPQGQRGSILRPPMSLGSSLADLMASGAAARLPGTSDTGGMYGPGGGGFDFGSLPDPNDMSQSPASMGSIPAHETPPAPPTGAAPITAPGGGTGIAYPTTAAAGRSPEAGMGAAANPAAVDTSGASGGLVHLGNGLYYDPVTDSLRGGNPSGGLSAMQTARQGRPV